MSNQEQDSRCSSDDETRATEAQIRAVLAFMGLEPGSDDYRMMQVSLRALKQSNPAQYWKAVSLD